MLRTVLPQDQNPISTKVARRVKARVFSDLVTQTPAIMADLTFLTNSNNLHYLRSRP